MGRERCGKKDWDMVWMGTDGARTEALDGQEMGWWGGMWLMIVKNGKKV